MEDFPRLTLRNVFNRHSIAGRIGLVALFTTSTCAIVIAWMGMQANRLREQSWRAWLHGQQYVKYSQQIESDLGYTAYLDIRYLQQQDPGVLANAQSTVKVIQTTLDSLQTFSNFIGEKTIRDLFVEVRKEVAAWLQLREVLYDNRDSAEKISLLQQRLSNQMQLIRKKIRYINNTEEIVLRRVTEEINQIRAVWFVVASIALITLTVSGVILFWLFTQIVLRFNARLQRHIDSLIHGNIPPDIQTPITELKPAANMGNELAQSYLRLKRLAEDVGSGNFRTQIRPFFGQGVLGAAITKMRDSLQGIADANAERNWFNEGFAQMSEILRTTSRDPELFYDSVISHLVKYLNITQGAIFARRDPEGNQAPYMEMQSGYAYDRKKFMHKHITQHEGLVGQAWRERDTIYLTEIPDEYSEITSTLGRHKPTSLLITPLIASDEVVGVVELASFSPFTTAQREFVQRISESVGATISRLKVDIEARTLLQESQNLADRLQAQEEEMRQNMEQLMAAQNLTERQMQTMSQKLDVLAKDFLMLEFNTDGRVVYVNEAFIKLSGFNEAELLTYTYQQLWSAQASEEVLERMWRSVLEGNPLHGEFTHYHKNGSRLSTYEYLYPITGLRQKINRIWLIGYDLTKQKEQETTYRRQISELQMSSRDVVNRIREVEQKAKQRLQKMQAEMLEQLREKERIIEELKET